MTYSIKVLGAETNLGSATNVDNATIVHIFNGHSAAVVIVRSDSSDVGIGSFSLGTGQMIKCEKDPSDKLSATANGGSVKVSKIAYS